MDDGYLDDFISLNERGHRQLEMNGLRERVAQVVNWSDRNVVAKERLSRVDLETILRIGDCLLYTSPSPRDKRQSRMPSSA